MKRSNKVLILLGLLAVVCIAAFAMTQYEEPKEAIQATTQVIMSLSGGSVDKLSWSNEDTTLAFHRNEKNAWLYDEDTDYPIDQTEIDTLLSEFEAMTASFVIKAVEDYSQYGLEAPLCTIALEADGQSYTVKLGSYSTIDSLRYVSIGDGNVYLLSTDPMDAFSATMDDLFLHDTMPELKNVTKLSFGGKIQTTIHYLEESGNSYCLDDVWFMDSLPLNTTAVKSYLSSLAGISLTDCATYRADTADLSDYGMDDPELTVTVSYTTEESDGTTIHRTAVVHLAVGLEGWYARIGDSRLIYEITEGVYEALTAVTYNDLRHTQIFTADFDAVTEIEITLEGNTHTLTSKEVEIKAEGEETHVVTQIIWSYGETEVEIDNIQSAIEALSATDFTQEAPAGQEEIRILLSVDSDYADTMEIVLYRRDGSTCLCEVNGEIQCMVSRSRVVDLVEAVNEIILN